MKKLGSLFFAALLTGFLASSCNDSGSGKGNDQDSTAHNEDTIVYDASNDCENLEPGTFCHMGTDFLFIGDSLTWNNNIEVKAEGATMKDTVFEEVRMAESGPDTAAWFVKIVRFADGDMYLEADFEEGHLLNRIRIETPSYAHASGIKVGSTVADIRSKFGTNVFVMPFEEFGVMEIISQMTQGRVIFHVPLGNYYSKDKEELAIDDLPQDLKVERIVVM